MSIHDDLVKVKAKANAAQYFRSGDFGVSIYSYHSRNVETLYLVKISSTCMSDFADEARGALSWILPSCFVLDLF